MPFAFDAEYLTENTGLKDITVLDSVGSTNNYLKEHAHEKNDGAVVIAHRQTSGRGRLGRTFVSPENGLYMSVLMKPDMSETAKLTGIAAVAVAQTIEAFSDKKPMIKWVNDVFVSGRKVCGILAEARFTNDLKPEYCIVGIGINLFEPIGGFDADIKDIAGSVFDSEEFDVNAFVAYLLNRLFALQSDENCIGEYRKRLIKREIKYNFGGKEHSGMITGVDDTYGLTVKEGENVRVLRYGEVEIKK